MQPEATSSQLLWREEGGALLLASLGKVRGLKLLVYAALSYLQSTPLERGGRSAAACIAWQGAPSTRNYKLIAD